MRTYAMLIANSLLCVSLFSSCGFLIDRLRLTQSQVTENETEIVIETPSAIPTDSIDLSPAASVESPRESESPSVDEFPVTAPTPDQVLTVIQEYDHDAVLHAWQTGDDTHLSAKNLAVLDMASSVIAETLTEEMSPYEKELSLHDWMLAHGQFDFANISHHPDDEPGPDNENPYGFFVTGKAVCYGYASTFQLLMDMSGIECITVNGTSGTERATHAWNMVKLDSDWYCVDVSWNDPAVSRPLTPAEAHKYFNVTGTFLRNERHYWQDELFPSAEGTEYAWTGAT